MVKKLAKHIREYKKYAILTPILVLGEVILEILIPLIMAELIDQGIDGGSMPEIIKYGIALLISAAVALALGGRRRKNFCSGRGRVCQKFERRHV